jgi:hypothetical protein
MKVIYITAIQDLKVSEYLGSGDRISSELFITNDSSLIKELVNNEFKVMAGMIEADYILNSDSIIYGINNIEDNKFVPQDYLLRQMQTCKFLLNFLWLIKDNSVNFDMAYLQCNEPRGVRTHSNYIAILYVNCVGKREKITFSRDELKLARKIFRTMFSKEPIEHHKGTGLQKGLQRIEVVFYFLQAVRSNKDLAIKIVNYCTCFESLFSTGIGELAHQLAERVAFFIGENSKERRDIFVKIKEAYGIRSKIVHGDLLSPSKIDNLSNISKNCDDLLRKILFKLLSDKDNIAVLSNTDKLDNFFLDKIFGSPISAEV